MKQALSHAKKAATPGSAASVAALEVQIREAEQAIFAGQTAHVRLQYSRDFAAGVQKKIEDMEKLAEAQAAKLAKTQADCQAAREDLAELRKNIGVLEDEAEQEEPGGNWDYRWASWDRGPDCSSQDWSSAVGASGHQATDPYMVSAMGLSPRQVTFAPAAEG